MDYDKLTHEQLLSLVKKHVKEEDISVADLMKEKPSKEMAVAAEALHLLICSKDHDDKVLGCEFNSVEWGDQVRTEWVERILSLMLIHGLDIFEVTAALRLAQGVMSNLLRPLPQNRCAKQLTYEALLRYRDEDPTTQFPSPLDEESDDEVS